MLAGCKKDDDTDSTTTTNANGEAVSLGSGDIAIINLIQAGKQLSTTLLSQIAATLTGNDKALVSALQAQQQVQRDTLKAAANANRTSATDAAFNLPDLPANFSTVDFTNRLAALTAAHGLLTTLVAGAAGALRYSARASTMTLLGQTLSVDARHLVALTSLAPGLAATDPQEGLVDGRNRSLRPLETATALNTFIAFGSRLLTGSLA